MKSNRVTPSGGPRGARLLVIAALRLHRESLARALAHAGGFDVIEASLDVRDCQRSVIESRPDVAVMEVTSDASLGLVRVLRRTSPRLKLIAVGVIQHEAEILPLLEAGATGYLPVDGSIDDLLEAIRRAQRNEMACDPRLTACLVDRLADLAGHERRAGIAALTAREQEILALMDEGLSNAEIGEALCIQRTTVKNHVHHILVKLEVRRRAQAVALVRDIAPPDFESFRAARASERCSPGGNRR